MIRILRAWMILVAASAASVFLAMGAPSAIWLGAALIGLALLKARVILSDYLDLYRAPRVRAGIMLGFVIWALVLCALLAAG